MHILVTNDDGVYAPGLLALAQAMQPLGHVTILAPDRNWSASGHVKTLHRPLRLKPTTLEDGTSALACDGAPSDCVALATLGAIPERIDLVVSGINPHANMGNDVTYSGTVTAAMEAVIGGLPGLAFSLAADDEASQHYYATAAHIAQRIVRKLVTQGLQPDLLLNINVPNVPIHEVRGMLTTRQGTRIYRDALDHRMDPRGRSYYWIGGDVPTGVPDEGTDFGAIARGYISITPLHLDMTSYRQASLIGAWDWDAA